jgi:hypothetical protein
MKLGCAELQLSILREFVSGNATQTDMYKEVLKRKVTFSSGLWLSVKFNVRA